MRRFHNATDEEIKKEYQKNNQQISIYYIASLYSEFAQGITLTPGDIKDYFAKNSFKFRRPISFNIDYVSFIAFSFSSSNPKDT